MTNSIMRPKVNKFKMIFRQFCKKYHHILVIMKKKKKKSHQIKERKQRLKKVKVLLFERIIY